MLYQIFKYETCDYDSAKLPTEQLAPVKLKIEIFVLFRIVICLQSGVYITLKFLLKFTGRRPFGNLAVF